MVVPTCLTRFTCWLPTVRKSRNMAGPNRFCLPVQKAPTHILFSHRVCVTEEVCVNGLLDLFSIDMAWLNIVEAVYMVVHNLWVPICV